MIDDLVLRIQSAVDRLARWARFGSPPVSPRRRFLIVQIDGLSARAFDRALSTGHAPILARLLRTRRLARRSMSVGIPSSTPAFQASLMYGVMPDIPGFHFHDKRAGVDLHFPRPGVADLVERRVAEGRRGILEGGACFGCVFTGGASESFLTFARLLKPTRAGLPLLRPLLSLTLLGWVLVKCLGLTAAEVVRFALRALAPRGWRRAHLKGLWLKIGFSIWIRQFFTLAVSADLYRGVPAIYVNYLDYDVFSHAFGPEHPAALRALRRLDRSVGQLARVIRRLPELGYDLYVCSDHGQTLTRYFADVASGRSIVDVVRAMLRDTAHAPRHSAGGHPARTSGRLGRAPRGERERFFNHAERDMRAVDIDAGDAVVRVVAAGPNAFVYWSDVKDPLPAEEIERRHPDLLAHLSAHPGIGFVLARSADGPVCWCRGRQVSLERAEDSPFAGRMDREVVLAGLRELMAMPSAGDIVLYGIGAPGGDVSFIDERGAHAGPSEAELHTFMLHPPSTPLPEEPITHPVQLYPHFAAYREAWTPSAAPELERPRARSADLARSSASISAPIKSASPVRYSQSSVRITPAIEP
jgi:Type I phosphodiesterase / nucleotide pyrophosphatase